MHILEEFRDYWREFVLLWDMFSEGLGDLKADADSILPACESCGTAEASVRCSDCTPGLVTCKDCLVSSHTYMPLHRIKVRLSDLPRTLANYSRIEVERFFLVGDDTQERGFACSFRTPGEAVPTFSRKAARSVCH